MEFKEKPELRRVNKSFHFGKPINAQPIPIYYTPLNTDKRFDIHIKCITLYFRCSDKRVIATVESQK